MSEGGPVGIINQNADRRRQISEIRKLEAHIRAQIKEGNLEIALRANEKLILLWEVLSSQSGEFVPDLARSLEDLSRRRERAGNQNDAFVAALRAVNYWRHLAKADLEMWGNDLVRALNHLAPLASEILNRHEFVTLKEEAAGILLQLIPTDEKRYLVPAARACLVLARTWGLSGNPGRAVEYAEQAVKLSRRLAAQDIVQHGPQLVRALRQLSFEQPGKRNKDLKREIRRVNVKWAVHCVLRRCLRREGIGDGPSDIALGGPDLSALGN